MLDVKNKSVLEAQVLGTINRACKTCGSSTNPEHDCVFSDDGDLLCGHCHTPVVQEQLGVLAELRSTPFTKLVGEIRHSVSSLFISAGEFLYRIGGKSENNL